MNPNILDETVMYPNVMPYMKFIVEYSCLFCDNQINTVYREKR